MSPGLKETPIVSQGSCEVLCFPKLKLFKSTPQALG